MLRTSSSKSLRTLPVANLDLNTLGRSSHQVLMAAVGEKFPTLGTASLWMPDNENKGQPEMVCCQFPESDSSVDTARNSAPSARTPRLAATEAGCAIRASTKHNDGMGASCGQLYSVPVSGGDGDGSGGSGRPSGGSTASNGTEYGICWESFRYTFCSAIAGILTTSCSSARRGATTITLQLQAKRIATQSNVSTIACGTSSVFRANASRPIFGPITDASCLRQQAWCLPGRFQRKNESGTTPYWRVSCWPRSVTSSTALPQPREDQHKTPNKNSPPLGSKSKPSRGNHSHDWEAVHRQRRSQHRRKEDLQRDAGHAQRPLVKVVTFDRRPLLLPRLETARKVRECCARTMNLLWSTSRRFTASQLLASGAVPHRACHAVAWSLLRVLAISL